MRAFEELKNVAASKDEHAEMLEREAARCRWKRPELECEVLLARVEAANIRRVFGVCP